MTYETSYALQILIEIRMKSCPTCRAGHSLKRWPGDLTQGSFFHGEPLHQKGCLAPVLVNEKIFLAEILKS